MNINNVIDAKKKASQHHWYDTHMQVAKIKGTFGPFDFCPIQWRCVPMTWSLAFQVLLSSHLLISTLHTCISAQLLFSAGLIVTAHPFIIFYSSSFSHFNIFILYIRHNTLYINYKLVMNTLYCIQSAPILSTFDYTSFDDNTRTTRYLTMITYLSLQGIRHERRYPRVSEKLHYFCIYSRYWNMFWLTRMFYFFYILNPLSENPTFITVVLCKLYPLIESHFIGLHQICYCYLSLRTTRVLFPTLRTLLYPFWLTHMFISLYFQSSWWKSNCFHHQRSMNTVKAKGLTLIVNEMSRLLIRLGQFTSVWASFYSLSYVQDLIRTHLFQY